MWLRSSIEHFGYVNKANKSSVNMCVNTIAFAMQEQYSKYHNKIENVNAKYNFIWDVICNILKI